MIGFRTLSHQVCIFCGLDVDSGTTVFCWYIVHPHPSPTLNMLLASWSHLDLNAEDAQ